jgi:hypothetical protein
MIANWPSCTAMPSGPVAPLPFGPWSLSVGAAPDSSPVTMRNGVSLCACRAPHTALTEPV